MSTFKKVIDLFEKMAINHKQINDFGWGDMSVITTKDRKFPLLYILPIQSAVGYNSFVYSFEIYIMDLEKPDKENLKDILSDTFLIGNDIIMEFQENLYEEDFENEQENITATPFQSTFDDNVAGWVYDIDIVTERIKCNRPYDAN